MDFENYIASDPTLKFLLREASFDYNHLTHQINVRASTFKVALAKYLDKKYPTPLNKI